VDALSSVRHPASNEQAFTVHRKDDVYSGPFRERAPELLLVPGDERIHVSSTSRTLGPAFESLQVLQQHNGWSGHHAVQGILLAAGPGVRAGEVPAGASVGQLTATLLALQGVEGDLELPAIEEILDHAALPSRRQVAAAPGAPDGSTLSRAQEDDILRRLRALGYE
jgi:predicted AlkP superfamily phosphohydrolase/phosphomutase